MLKKAGHAEVVNKEAFESLAAEAGLAGAQPKSNAAGSPGEQSVGGSRNSISDLEMERNEQKKQPILSADVFVRRCFALVFITVGMQGYAFLMKGAFHHDASGEHGAADEHGAEEHGAAEFDEMAINFTEPIAAPITASTLLAGLLGSAAEHGAAAEEHGAAAEHGAEHGGHGGHHATEPWYDMQWILVILLALIGLTVIFEEMREYLEEELAKYALVIERIWSELTVLGFLALMTFLMLQGGILPAVSLFAYGDPEHLIHMFEKIHFALFFVLVLFLMWALWLLACVAKREQILDAHETQIIYYGRLAKAKGGSEGPSVEDYGHHQSPARGPQTRRPLRRTVFGAA